MSEQDMAKHTPGPWSVVEYGDGDQLVVHDARGDWRVCFMATPGKAGDFEGIEANARLIAAAPESHECALLLDSLCAWLLHRFGPDSPEGREAAFRQAKASAAIAKATGAS